MKLYSLKIYYETNFYSPIASVTEVMTIREATTTEAVDGRILLIANEYQRIKVDSFKKFILLYTVQEY